MDAINVTNSQRFWMTLARIDLKVFDQKMTGNIVKLMTAEFRAEKIIAPLVMQVGR